MTLTKKTSIFIITLVLLSCSCLMFVGCTSNQSGDSSNTSLKNVTMNEESVDSLKDSVGKSDVVFFDVRKAEDYSAGHIIGSINADMDKTKDGDSEDGLATMKKVIEDNSLKDQKLVICCYTGKKYAQAGTNVLNEIGYDMSKVVTLQGGMEAWTQAGLRVAKDVVEVQMSTETVDVVKSKVGQAGVIFIDARKSDDYSAGHIEGAISADMDQAKDGNTTSGLLNLDKVMTENNMQNQQVILICYNGQEYSQVATNCLAALGYDMTRVFTLESGMNAWTDAGLTVTTSQSNSNSSTSAATSVEDLESGAEGSIATQDSPSANGSALDSGNVSVGDLDDSSKLSENNSVTPDSSLSEDDIIADNSNEIIEEFK